MTMIENAINLLQLIGGIILSIGYIPQIKKIIKSKSVKDFDGKYLFSLLLGVGLMEIYAVYSAIHGVAIMFLVTNTIAFICAAIMYALYLTFKNKK